MTNALPDTQAVEKTLELLEKSKSVLIALPKNPDPDAIGSALAIAALLRKMPASADAHRVIDIACERGDFSRLSYMQGTEDIQVRTAFSRTFTISLDTSKSAVDQISYTSPVPERLEIEIVPKSGSFTPGDVSFSAEAAVYDTIVMVDTPSLDMLGGLYSQNAEMFFSAVKVNIDNHISNENFGNVNLVDITAAATSEVVYELIKAYGPDVVGEPVATALLTGIISETGSFQNPATTPSSFLRAAELVHAGGRQQEIIRALFKTRQFSMIKLWGRAMARIAALPEFGTVYSTVTEQDVERAGASEADILAVAREFSRGTGDAKVTFLFLERDGNLEVYISSNPNIKLGEVVHYFGGSFINASIGYAKLMSTSGDQVERLLGDMYAKLKDRIGL